MHIYKVITMRLDDLLEGYAQTLAAGQARDEFAAAAGFRNKRVSPYHSHQGKHGMKYYEHGGPHYNPETGLMESAPGDEGFTQDPDFEGVSYETSTSMMKPPETVEFGDEGWDPHKATQSTGDSTKVTLQYDMQVWQKDRFGRGGEWVTIPAGTEMSRSEYMEHYNIQNPRFPGPQHPDTNIHYWGPGNNPNAPQMKPDNLDRELKDPQESSSTHTLNTHGHPTQGPIMRDPQKEDYIVDGPRPVNYEMWDRPMASGPGGMGVGAPTSDPRGGSGSQGGSYDQGEEFNTYMDALTGNIQQTQEMYMKYGGKYKYPYGGKIR